MILTFDYLVVSLLVFILIEMIVGVFITARMSIWWLRRNISWVVIDIVRELSTNPETVTQLQDMIKKMMPQLTKSMRPAEMRNLAFGAIAQMLLNKFGGGGLPPMPPSSP